MSLDGISDRLHALLDKLTKNALKNLLIAALDEMEGYNGQSKTSAICRAIGAEEIDDEDDGSISWKLPSHASIQKHFSD